LKEQSFFLSLFG